MNTSCEFCVFAGWDGNKQSSCDFDRLEKFQEQGTDIVLEDNGQKQYYIIEGRVCNTCRHPDTLLKAKIPARKWKKHVRQEVVPRIAMAVYVDYDGIEDAILSLKSIYHQTIKPYEIILIYNVDGLTPPPAYAIWFTSYANNIPWRIETIMGVPAPLQDELVPADYARSIDLTMNSKDIKSVYFSVCKAGYEFPPDYIEIIDQAINDDLIRFIALLPDEDGNGLFLQRGLHNFLQGSKGMYVVDKIKEIAQEENTKHMIKSFEELRQCI